MRRSEAFLCTSRERQTAASDAVGLALRAGLVRQFGSGLYAFTPTGQRVRQNVIDVVRSTMRDIGGQEMSLPQLQYKPVWAASGRWKEFEGEMFTLSNRDGQEMCLAPSHEEGVVHLVDGAVRSYDDLPLLLFQIREKHRDDHARGGLLRTKEFTMKDAYSLHVDEASLDEWYARVRRVYGRIFDALGVEYVVVEADNSVMGGSTSEEFVAPVDADTADLVHCTGERCRFGVTDERADFDAYDAGDDCPECGAPLAASGGIEVGHAFKLGTRYSESMDLTVDLADGETRHVVMGSYGLGVTRVVQTLIEQHAGEDGCRWPVTDAETVAPFTTAIVPLSYEGDLADAADRLYDELDDALLFDGDASIGERFAESDLLGISMKVILGNHYRETGEVELETRDGETRYVDFERVSTVLDEEL